MNQFPKFTNGIIIHRDYPKHDNLNKSQSPSMLSTNATSYILQDSDLTDFVLL